MPLKPWSGLPDGFALDAWQRRYAANIEPDPKARLGCWASSHGMVQDARVLLDLGCGKGALAIALALCDPAALVVGLDIDAIGVAVAAGDAHERGAANVVFAQISDGELAHVFAPNELDAIYLDFPTPYPQGRNERSRLTWAERLLDYSSLLRDGGDLRMRTDNRALYLYTLGQLDLAGFEVLRACGDAGHEGDLDIGAYGRRALVNGAKICEILARNRQGLAYETCFYDGSQGGACSRLYGRDLSASLYDYVDEFMLADAYTPQEMRRGLEALRREHSRKLAMRPKGREGNLTSAPPSASAARGCGDV